MSDRVMAGTCYLTEFHVFSFAFWFVVMASSLHCI